MRVLNINIITNLDERCGNASDGRALGKYLQQAGHNVELIPSMVHSQRTPDVMILNWHPARVSIDVQGVRYWQSCGAKVILILQNSDDQPHLVVADDLVCRVDAVVAHEPMEFWLGPGEAKAVPVHYIPVCVIETPQSDLPQGEGSSEVFGVAGFPFSWKRPDVVIEAAKRCGVQARIFCPAYDGVEYPIRKWRHSYPGRVDLVSTWMPEEQVISTLSESALNIFWYQSESIHDQYGQSGSVRMGISAGRPMIISRHRKFRDLFPYEDCFYICDTEEQVYETATRVLADLRSGKPVKYPRKAFEEMRWSKGVQKYLKVIQEVCGA